MKKHLRFALGMAGLLFSLYGAAPGHVAAQQASCTPIQPTMRVYNFDRIAHNLYWGEVRGGPLMYTTVFTYQRGDGTWCYERVRHSNFDPMFKPWDFGDSQEMRPGGRPIQYDRPVSYSFRPWGY